MYEKLGVIIARAAILFCTSLCGICPSFEKRGNLIVERAVYSVQDSATDIEIFYPQLHGFADAEKEKTINQLIENDAKKLIAPLHVEKQQENSLLCVWLDYEVKFLNDNVLSIFYAGFDGYMLPGKGPDATAMGTTIDIENECLITLDDFITDFETLSELLWEDKFESITAWDGISGGYRISEEYRGDAERLLAALMDNSKSESHYIEWYTAGEKLVIVSLYGGDYYEYAADMDMLQGIVTLKFKEKVISEYLYCENGEWEDGSSNYNAFSTQFIEELTNAVKEDSVTEFVNLYAADYKELTDTEIVEHINKDATLYNFNESARGDYVWYQIAFVTSEDIVVWSKEKHNSYFFEGYGRGSVSLGIPLWGDMIHFIQYEDRNYIVTEYTEGDRVRVFSFDGNVYGDAVALYRTEDNEINITYEGFIAR